MPRPTPLLLPLLAATGCGPGFADRVPLLEVPASVEAEVLPDTSTPVGVSVRNVGTDTAFIRANATGGAELDEVRFRLEPGDRTELLVLLTARGYGRVEGEVSFLLRDELTVVPVTGQVPDDVDGDGYDAEAVGGPDCDDLDPERNPGAPEACNGIDDDCDGSVDEDLPEEVFWFDGDDDGFGDPDRETQTGCRAPDSYVDNDEDCDDEDPDVSPAAVESWYDGFDENCDGLSDFDQDYDGVDASPYGADCDDEEASVYPGAPELDDLVDNDCDTYRDEDVIGLGDLVFTELFVDPVTGTPGAAEWLEIVNTSSTHVDVSLVRLVVDAEAAFLADTEVVIAPDGIWMVCSDPRANRNGGVESCGTHLPTFPTGARTFTLQGPETVVDLVVASGWGFTAGRSLELASDQLDGNANDDEANWCVGVSLFGDLAGDRGTPGDVLPPCP